MAAYKRTFAEKSDILLLDPNSDFFKYLNDSQSLKN
jgi:membrane protease subunit HflC